ncbi:MAG: hypothetical protein J7L15_08975 [Clostridiales bacterium]|nr:hypothetical protein [Clostridiales bacterium]
MKTTHQSFLSALSIHNNKYSYNNVIFVDNITKVQITCPIHGDFEQTPKKHKKGQGCPKCARILIGNKIKDTILEFVTKANKVHFHKYTYENAVYVKSSIKINITCPIHGDFEQTPNNHLFCKTACPKCLSLLRHRRSCVDEFITKANKVHSHKYTYENTEYIESSMKVIITCVKHGDFKQNAASHIRGAGCPYCANAMSQYQKYKDKETTLYYIYFPDYDLYKIGLTRQTVQIRFKQDIKLGVKINTISTKSFKDGIQALQLEQLILSVYSKYQYHGDNIIGAGNTELFTQDILKEYY